MSELLIELMTVLRFTLIGGGGRMLMGCYGNEGCYGDNGRLIIVQRKVLIVCLTALLPLSV